MANEFDNNQYTNPQEETGTESNDPIQTSASEQPAQTEEPKTQTEQTESGEQQPNFIPYQDYANNQAQTEQSADYNPYTGTTDSQNQNTPEQNQAQNEPFSYTPYPPNSQDDNKFTPIDYSQLKDNQGKEKAKGKGPVIFLTILVVIFAIAAAAFAGVYFSGYTPTSSQNDQTTANSGPSLTLNSKPESDDSSSFSSSDGKLTVTQIAKKVRPSVVGIVAYTAQSTLGNFGESSTATSSGSGVIMSADGYIITNAHVIEGASRVSVVLDNDDEYEAKIIGSDSKTDLAVIKIDETNLTAAQFGDSSETQVGEDVVAIGNPAGLQLAGSLTRGIVSAVERPIQSSSGAYTMNCIQTDAAINPGNSGGALVNMYGQVIGINSSKISSVDYEGIGFAISANDVQPIVDDLVKYGYVKDRAKLGITYQEISETYAAYQGVPAGLYVNSVDESLDAYAQGLRAGDIITKIDGKSTTGSETITEYLKKKSPGDKVKLTVYRYSATGSGKTLTITVTLSEDKGDSSTTSTTQNNNNGGSYGSGQNGTQSGSLY